MKLFFMIHFLSQPNKNTKKKNEITYLTFQSANFVYLLKYQFQLVTLFNHDYFAAGHATESFSDFVVGHGELWSAQMLSYTIKKVSFLS